MKKHNKPVTIWLLACSTVVSIGLVVPWVIWQSQAPVPLHIMIIDKSRPDLPYQGHKGLIWLLNQQKIVKQTGEHYSYTEDYYGYDIENGVPRIKQSLPDEVTDTDLIYLTAKRSSLSARKNERRQGGLDEGLTIYDVQKIRKAADKGITVAAEYTALANGTSKIIREQLYAILGVNSSGWQGRSVSDLQSTKEVPEWIRINYEQREKRTWDYHGSGVLLVHVDGQVRVLERGLDVKTGTVQFAFTQEGQDWIEISEDIYYTGWFDILEKRPTNAILASYKMDLTENGKQKLERDGIPSDFPALVRSDDENRSYYMAGSFGEMKRYSFLRRVWGWDEVLGRLLPNQKEMPDMFYWKVYVPVMKHILQEVEEGCHHWP